MARGSYKGVLIKKCVFYIPVSVTYITSDMSERSSFSRHLWQKVKKDYICHHQKHISDLNGKYLMY